MNPPDFDVREFRTALGSFPTGVAIITTNDAAGQPVGLTCNSFSSVSLDPPLVSWSLRLSSKSLAHFQQANAFAVHILAEDQRDLSSRFASSLIADKFDGVAHSRGHRDLPLIDNCVASFECDKFAEHIAGDHVLFLGRVARFDHGRVEDSLVFYRGAYAILTQSLRELAAKGGAEPFELDQARRLIHGLLLRLACENGTEAEFAAIDAVITDIERYSAPEDRDRRSEAGLSFFRLIAQAAHNDVLLVVSDSLASVLRMVLKAETDRAFRPALVPLRREVLGYLRARDTSAAQGAMNRYLDALRRTAQ